MQKCRINNNFEKSIFLKKNQILKKQKLPGQIKDIIQTVEGYMLPYKTFKQYNNLFLLHPVNLFLWPFVTKRVKTEIKSVKNALETGYQCHVYFAEYDLQYSRHFPMLIISLKFTLLAANQ